MQGGPVDSDRDSKEVVIVVGTRPEIIKTAPVIRAVRETAALRPYLIHTGQHYDEELSEAFFEVLDLPTPDTVLGVGSGTHGQQTADGLVNIEQTLEKRTPAAVLAQGDTNAVLSTALAVSKHAVPFGHIEAGLRSFDRSMPEETNRVIADHVSDFLFAPTETAVENLAAEGITGNVHLTGNTIVDACHRHAETAAQRSQILDRIGASESEYVVATVHRPRNTDERDRLLEIVEALDDTSIPVFFPVHPRTEMALKRSPFTPSGSLRLIEPLDYVDFIQLLRGTRAVVTDSGGVQEEAAVLEVPCLTVRPTTERPETVDAGVNRLVEPERLGRELTRVLKADSEAMTGSPDLYGNGSAGEQIVEVLRKNFDEDRP